MSVERTSPVDWRRFRGFRVNTYVATCPCGYRSPVAFTNRTDAEADAAAHAALRCAAQPRDRIEVSP